MIEPFFGRSKVTHNPPPQIYAWSNKGLLQSVLGSIVMNPTWLIVGNSGFFPSGANFNRTWVWRFLDFTLRNSSLFSSVGVYYNYPSLGNYINGIDTHIISEASRMVLVIYDDGSPRPFRPKMKG